MPGAGKSTIGVEVADTLSCGWIDTDQIIEQKTGMKLNQYIKKYGVKKFKKLEESVLLELNCVGRIISTGGSVIYSKKGMEHLKKLGMLVYLDVEYKTIEQRIMQNPNRGIANNDKALDLKELYDKRIIKYQEYADHTINANNKSITDIVYEVIELI